MTEKLLHVSCLVRDGHLWELLRALEEHKVGNVEVRPVAPATLALPPPERKGKAKYGTVLTLVRAAMPMKEPMRVPQLARQLGVKHQSTHSAIHRLVQDGLVKRTALGLYTRVKPDPINGVGETK